MGSFFKGTLLIIAVRAFADVMNTQSPESVQVKKNLGNETLIFLNLLSSPSSMIRYKRNKPSRKDQIETRTISRTERLEREMPESDTVKADAIVKRDK